MATFSTLFHKSIKMFTFDYIFDGGDEDMDAKFHVSDFFLGFFLTTRILFILRVFKNYEIESKRANQDHVSIFSLTLLAILDASREVKGTNTTAKFYLKLDALTTLSSQYLMNWKHKTMIDDE